MGFTSTVFALALTSISSVVYAQQTELNPIVVTGARIEQSLSDVLPSVTVITRQDIENSQAISIADLLQGEPGFELGRNGGIGTVTSFFLRGENSVSMAIYVDGVKAQTDGFGNVLAVNIPLGLIDHIEIIRGNSSALYGEAAIGGVINIFTRQGNGAAPKAYGSISYGSRNTLDATAGYGGQVNGTKFSLTLNDQSTDGFPTLNINQYPSSNPNTGEFSGQSLNGILSQKLSNDLEAGTNVRLLTNNIAYGDPNAGMCLYCDGTGSTTTFNQKTTSSDLTGFADYNITQSWNTRLDVTRSNLAYDLYSNANIPALTNTFGYNPLFGVTDYSPNAIQTSGRWFNTYKLNGGPTFNFGVDYTQANYDDGLGDQMTRDSLGYFGGYNQRFNKFDVQVNARHDEIKVDEPDSGNATQDYQANTGLLGLGYYITDNFKVTGTTSTGFRAPAVGEIFGFPAEGFPSAPNFNLTPETHYSREFGLVYNQTNVLARVVYFNTTTDNAITYEPVGSGFEYINVPTITNHGFEFSAKAKIEGVNIEGAFTSQDPVNASGAPVLLRANEFGSIGLDVPVSTFDFGMKVISSGSRQDSYFDATSGNTVPVTLGSYQIWNFFISDKLTDEWTARIKLENAFNEGYQLDYGYNTPPRGVFLTLTYQQK